MKRLGSLDSLGALMTICPITETEEQSRPGNTLAYGSEFQSILELGLDEECGVEESGQICEKKRRLRVDQVKALEKNFEVENKLEPERKVELAHELGLQPRQVAVWFQNRRARWKTKQLERDYGLLKANYDALKHNFDDLQRDNESLLEEIRGLKSKLEESPETKVPLKKEELMASDSVHNKVIGQSTNPPAASVAGSEDIVMTTADLNHESFDSDSSAILNEDTNSPKSNAAAAAKISVLFESKTSLGEAQKARYQPQFVKVEEHNFFSGDEACNFFSEEQAPTLHWYCSDHWN